MPRPAEKPSLADIDVDALSPAARRVFDEILWQHVIDEVPLAEIAERLELTTAEVRASIEFFGCEVEASLGGARLPELEEAAYEALREDIAERGQLVPIIVDAAGGIVDGHNRMRACRELGLEPWTVVRHDADPRDGLAANLNRRQLNQAQKRRVIVTELIRDAEQSDRAIARFVGVDHTTVGAARRELARLRGRLEGDGGGIHHPAPEARPRMIRVREDVYLALEEIAREAVRSCRCDALADALARWQSLDAAAAEA